MKKNVRANDKIKKYLPIIRPFLIIFGIYCVAMIAIWRSGVSYIDDNGRLITGKGWTSDFNRYSSSLLSFLLIQMRLSLVDISPWSQIIAMTLLAVTSLIVVQRYGDSRKIHHLVLSTLVGLTPFTLNCWLYKFDAPCMALALLCSVLPFAQLKDNADKKQLLRFTIASLLCLMITLTSYQAFCGVYLLMFLGIILQNFITKQPFKNLPKYLGCGAIAFILSLIIFKFLLPTPTGYRPIEMLSLSAFVPGVTHNISKIFQHIITIFAPNWLFFVALMLVCFIVSLYLNSKRTSFHKLFDILVGIIFIVCAVPASYGIYLFLADAPTNPRSLVGFGAVLTIIAIMTAQNLAQKRHIITKICIVAPAIIATYLFFIYAFALGNALAEQKRYSDYRNTELAANLASIYPDQTELANKKIRVIGSINYAPSVQHTIDLYPITGEIIDDMQIGLSSMSWGSWQLRFNYGLEYDHVSANEENWDCADGYLKFDGYYHTIIEQNDAVCIEIK